MQAPAGGLLCRESLFVSCRVTINRMESLSFSFKRLCCRKEHHCLPLPTHTLYTEVFADCCRVVCVYVCLCNTSMSPLCLVGFLSIWATEDPFRLSAHILPTCSHALLSLVLLKISRTNILSIFSPDITNQTWLDIVLYTAIIPDSSWIVHILIYYNN